MTSDPSSLWQVTSGALRRGLALLAVAGAGAHAAGSPGPVQEVTFGPAPVSSYWGQRIQPLSGGEAMLGGSYRVKAELVPRFASDDASDLGVALQPSGVPRTSQGTSTVELAPPSGTRLRRYGTLVVEHDYRPGCPAELDMVLQSPQPGASRQVVNLQKANGTNAAEAMAEQPHQMEWARKDLGYIVRRQLGLAPDLRWRYAQDGDFTVLQRRMDVPLRRSHTIQLEFPSKTVLSGVNLSIGKGTGARATQLLSGSEFTSRTEDDGTRTRVSLYLGSILSDTARWGTDPHLAEILIAYQGTEAEVAARKPLQSMRVLADPEMGAPASDSGQTTKIQTLKDEASGKLRRRYQFALRDLQGGPPEAHQDVVGLAVQSPSGCDLGPIRAHLIQAQRAPSQPVFQSKVGKTLEKLGGPFLPPREGSVEWLQWMAWLPIAQAQPTLGRSDIPGFHAELPGWAARWQWTGDKPVATVGKEGMQASGIRTAQLEWKTDVTVQPQLRIYVDMPAGARQFETLHAELQLDSGAVERFEVGPNRAQLLPPGLPAGSRVQAVRVRFQPTGAAEDWTLAGVGIFRSDAVPHSLIAEQPRPGWKLLPQALARQTGLPADGTYRWDSSPAPVRAGDLLQARITQGTGAAPSEACWLTLEVTGDRGSHARQRLCPVDTEWQTGLSEILRNGGFAADETVKTMAWTAHLSTPPAPGAELGVVLGVGTVPSVRQALADGLVLRLGTGHTALQPDRSALQDFPALPAPVWLDYGTWIGADGQPAPSVHWDDEDLFELRRITWVAETALWPRLADRQEAGRRQSQQAAPSPEAGLRMQSAWLVLFAAAVLLATLRMPALKAAAGRWTLPGHRSRAVHSAWAPLRTAVSAYGEPALKVVGVALACFWIWRGGRGGPDAPWFIAAGGLLVLTVCIGLWLPRVGSPAALAPLRATVAVLWLAWLAWLAGTSGFPKQLLTCAALLAAAALLLGHSTLAKGLPFLRTAAASPALLVGACSAGLYAIGLASTAVVRRENLWITMGAIVAVAAWWLAMHAARPALEAFRPRWASKLYGVPGGPLFVGAVAALVLSMAALWLGQSGIAAHLTTLFFYLWCAGALLTGMSLWARSAPDPGP
ncbi:hypothetical protein M4R22_04740 [Acidovorax sp. GBBC 3334]|uniref:hypothetical protein n=1 Tax=Acidovorax sp. GBBC 3334 TaxID=2940496 RepID=UPI002303CEFC|nr:hypothetical protein [Acidovorax sp. GBBC 3334]MDA8454065.1 hypothetical protein [Acidovorax sp. GBBC 3334]